MDQSRRSLPQTLVYALPSILEPLSVAQLFAVDQLIEVELGSGDGSFLVQYASRRRERNFIGIERLLGRIQKMSRKGLRAQLNNLAGIRIESSYFLQYLLPAKSITALHVYFPDPWPKRKHVQNRLINDQFPGLARRVLVPDGSVYLRTDDNDYFEQMRAVFAGSQFFREVETPLDLQAMLTDFERDFNAQGISTLRAAYQLL